MGAVWLFCLAFLQACGGGDNETPASADPKEVGLTRVEPADGESTVPRNRPVTLTFSTTVLPESIDDQSIRIRFGPTFGTRPAGTFQVSGNIVQFDPTVLPDGSQNSVGFPAGEQMLVEVPIFTPQSGEPAALFVQNVEGNPIAVASGKNSITFTTGSGWVDPVSGPPGVLGIEFIPKANAFGQVPANAAVTVIFSEPMNPETVRLGDNIFLTNNSPTSPFFQQDIISQMFFDGSLTRYTFQPTFGFGQGPFNIAVNFIDPDAPLSFETTRLPADLVGNGVQNFTFLGTFDTQFNPTAINADAIQENFETSLQRDIFNTTAMWGDDSVVPFTLVGPEITTTEFTLTIGGAGVISTFVGNDFIAQPPQPPVALGRRVMNLYRVLNLPAGTMVRAGWGPGNNQTFASTYPRVTVRIGHKVPGTQFAVGNMFNQFDVDGWVTVADVTDYRVTAGTANTFFDFPTFDRFFDFNGNDDFIIDVEALPGTTSQNMRTGTTTDGDRQMFSVFNGNVDLPSNDPFSNPPILNPINQIAAVLLEVADLNSIGTSIYYDTGVDDPDYFEPVFTPTVQPGGSSISMEYAGSDDGLVDDVSFTPDINQLDGLRFVRFQAQLKSNFATGARARINKLDIPFSIP